jgi:hypothetical protein
MQNNQLPRNDGSRRTTTRRIISAVMPLGRSLDGVTGQRRGQHDVPAGHFTTMKKRRRNQPLDPHQQPSTTYDWAMVRSGRIIVVIIILTISWWIISTFATNRHDDRRRRILIFDTTQLSNQGAGNLLTGLYAAHLLGVEFHRTVCTVYPDLLVHFAPSLQRGEEPEDCHSTRMTIHHHGRRQQQQQEEEERLVILDYQITDECHVQRVLASSVPVVVLSGNTYPRWPRRRSSGQPRLNFLDWYRPRPEFLLRYYSIINNNNSNSSTTSSTTTTTTTPPASVVVHLRSPDDVTLDPREGLDEASLRQMEQLVVGANTSDGHNVFLVTNKVSLYQRFAKCCHWSHANWDVVAHSANGVVWDNRNRTTSSSTKSTSSSSSTISSPKHQQHRHRSQQERHMLSSANNHNDRRSSQQQQQNFQLWSDWYTIYRADIVYHTRSAFSQSAHRWATGSGGGRPDDDDDQDSHRRQRQRPPQQSFVFTRRNGRLLVRNDTNLDDEDDGEVKAVTTILPLSRRSHSDLQHCGVYEQRVRDNEVLFRGLDFTKPKH